ncbi:sarcosine oxidase subunit gamma [Roseovarius indicus]|uniref:sarcosine oxidase subunit gamma n=1 Tax=Roseovarius indicus TaxID=540747 RepID=UPI0007DA29D6|nr:sarcosine oxidase subunit gamma family protein [Roseovarius indicus]OAO06171.1 sarcosine oxidase subunit gamma [Roseovarius indicus]
MSDAVSALKGASFDGTVTVRDAGLQGMITLRGDLGSAKMTKAVKDATGAAKPGQREITAKGDSGAAWMSPDELLVMVPYDTVADALARIETALKGEHFLAVNVSDARAMFEIKGAGVREIIAKLCPVDMAPGAFEPGSIRRTRMAQVAAAVWMTDAETIRVVCFRSVAEYVFGLLCDAAEPGGEVGYFA